MKQISPGLAAHIAGEVTTLATCWKLIRRDATVLGFTDHDQEIVFGGVAYQAVTGFTPSAIANNVTLGVDNLDIEGVLTSDSITEADIMAGKYDFAEMEIFQVNYRDLAQGEIKLRRGWLGEVSMRRQHFVAEVRGLAQRLSQTIGELYSSSCRATLGDARCKVNMAEHTVSGSVTGGGSAHEFFDGARAEAQGIFSFGILTFTGGDNAGLSVEVKEHLAMPGGGGRFFLALPMPYLISAGDAYTLTKGCDKTIGACAARFDNMVNFRGEPAIPGLDRMLETAGTRSEW